MDPQIFILKSIDHKYTKNNKLFYSCVFTSEGNNTEQYKVLIWNDIIEISDPDCFFVGSYSTLQGGRYDSKYDNYSITGINLVKRAVLGIPEAIRTEYINWMCEYLDVIEKLDAPRIQTIGYCKELFQIYSSTYCFVSASTSHHHAYIGGLSQHVIEMLCTLSGLLHSIYESNKSNSLDVSLMILGIIFHDFFKVKEYIWDNSTSKFSYNKKECPTALQGHIFEGSSYFYCRGAYDIAQIIASHHQKKEWGAIVEPQSKEEILIHHIDDISAKTGLITVLDFPEVLSIDSYKKDLVNLKSRLQISLS